MSSTVCVGDGHDQREVHHVTGDLIGGQPSHDSCRSSINAVRRGDYASMPAERKALLLRKKRMAYAETKVCNNKRRKLLCPKNPNRIRRSRILENDLSSSGGVKRLRRNDEHGFFTRLEDIAAATWVPIPAPHCQFCGARHFYREPPGFCCQSGQVSLSLPRMPDELWDLYTNPGSDKAAHFRRRCQTYNNTSAFSSLGITYDPHMLKSNRGIYALRVQGPVYHFIRDLIPTERPGRQLQLYFYGTETEIDNRLAQSGDLDAAIIHIIFDIMKHIPYAMFFRNLGTFQNLQDYTIVLRADPCLDMRVYNLLVVDNVAAIWNELTDVPNNQPHDVRVYTSSGRTHRVHYYFGCYDPLQYPLLFPYGEPGWHTRIERLRAPRASNPTRQNLLYKGQNNVLPQQHASGEDLLEDEQASMACQGESSGAKIGKRFVLPATFVGSPRDMRRRYLNVLALVAEYGKPDFFITMTCNPNWPEIRDELLPEEEAQSRSDLVAKVFRARNEELKDEIVNKKLFGEVAAYLYVIEFQKRGLPHAHWIIILAPKYKIVSVAAYDRFVTAEIPDANLFPHLHACVVRHMIHGPCGELNPSNICMREAVCKNKYPKDIVEETFQLPDSYPSYRRRDDGTNAKVRGQLLNNRWVVPYNKHLLAKFDCHINVEICVGFKLIKYLYKYVCKGTDRVAFNIVEQSEAQRIDEISDFQSARWLRAPEAMWRIYAFKMSEIHPTVMRLPIHLDHHHQVWFHPSRYLKDVVANPNASKTPLTEYFAMNVQRPSVLAMNFLYKDFPRHFVWLASCKVWQKRKKGKCYWSFGTYRFL